ncbi:nuclear transport factor 2 family protein [Lactiplantibacillus plantarum]|uniref:nuclear transport factor 2 family protein n=1 Tax=Lactiplantibacillus plantarum TaxID=1590 RepID=UPI001EE997C1|nr:nuclear transport factor 2 family protein [Lactiplantibacillus plantarum]
MTEIETALLRDRKAKVQQYFAMWVTRDFEALPRIFAVDCYYQECYGPAYLSLAEVQAWIEHQLRVQRVTAWSIQRLWSATDNMIFAQWSFTAVRTCLESFQEYSQEG